MGRRRAPAVLARWSEWAANAPDEATSSARLVRLPWLSRLPETLRGRRLVTIDGAILGGDEHGRELLRELRGLRPEIDSFGPRSAATLLRRIGDIDRATPVISDHVVLGTLDADATGALAAAAGVRSGPALDRAAPARRRARPLGARRGRARLAGRRRRPLRRRHRRERGPARGGQEQLGHIRAAMAPWAAPAACLNFAEGPADPRDAFTAPTFRRLRAVRARVDPSGVFAAGHAIPTS